VVQCDAVWCRVLQCGAGCYRVWQGVHVMGYVSDSDVAALLALAKVCCRVLKCGAGCCSVVQCGAGCCSVVQGVAGCGRVCTLWGMSVTVMWLLCLP